MANASGRFFGWVMGSSLPAALAADWLVSAWDQNAGMRDATPGVVGVEEVAAAWLLQLLGLPVRCGRRLRDRRHDGELHLPGRGARPGARPGRLGRRGRRALPAPRGCGCSSAPRGTGRWSWRCATWASACPSRSPSTSRAGWTPRTSARRLAGGDGAGDRLPAGRQHPLRRVRSRWPRAVEVAHSRRRLGARRRRLRALGRRRPGPGAADRRPGRGGLLGDRRAQDAEHPLRRRHRDRRRRRRACTGRWACTRATSCRRRRSTRSRSSRRCPAGARRADLGGARLAGRRRRAGPGRGPGRAPPAASPTGSARSRAPSSSTTSSTRR